ncbi:hypothetical protein F8388_004495 [Cannabis sativa]|uniref:Uncharacterized protein n=1 Tax=Cannabis sativa TaxID=3483 RepID=A0A7J6ENJ8_CANSA|nr:hypothetical protein F8388_004495 [Cannabis sativa]
MSNQNTQQALALPEKETKRIRNCLSFQGITCIHALHIRLEFAPRNIAIPTPSRQSHKPLIHSHSITAGEQVKIEKLTLGLGIIRLELMTSTTSRVEKPNATILEQLGVGPSFCTITDTKIMGKIGFNCQLFLSKIGSTTDSSHITWFHKTVLHEEDFAQHVLFDTEKNCLFYILSAVPLRPRALRNRSNHIDIPSTQHRSSKGSRRPTKARKLGSFRKWIPIRRVHNRMDKLTLTRQFKI